MPLIRQASRQPRWRIMTSLATGTTARLAVAASPMMLNARPRRRTNQCGTSVRAASVSTPCPLARSRVRAGIVAAGRRQGLLEPAAQALPGLRSFAPAPADQQLVR